MQNMLLVRRVRDGNSTAFALVDIGALDGAKIRFNAALDSEPLPGMAQLGDYRILRLSAPWRLVSGTVVFGTADLEDAWVVGKPTTGPLSVRRQPLPIVCAFGAPK